MLAKDIDHFFECLDKELHAPTRVILIGGAAATLYGSKRPTEDIDFELQTSEPEDQLAKAILAAEMASGIKAQYSTDIDHWGMISLGDYRKHTRPYKKIGKITVELLQPEYWSIGKVSRYYDSDVEDMVLVFKRQKTDPNHLLAVWQEALKYSPVSNALFLFKQQVAQFFRQHGRGIWGAKVPLLNPFEAPKKS